VAAGASARLFFSTQTERYHVAIAAARRETRLLLDIGGGCHVSAIKWLPLARSKRFI
jgi:hypothetical protein